MALKYGAASADRIIQAANIMITKITDQTT